jgi:hypothetical protein
VFVLILASPVFASAASVSASVKTSEARLAAQVPPTVGNPTISGLQGNGFELGIRLGPDGTIYTHAPGALSSDTSWVWRSLDGGRTHKWVPVAVPLTGKFGACPGGGDTEVDVDDAGNLFFIDLTLVNFSTARSRDKGRTIDASSCTAVPSAPNDRQWYAHSGDVVNGGTLYLTYNIFGGGQPLNCPNGALITANNQLVLTRSPAPGAQALAGVQFAPVEPISGPCEESIMGNNEVSPRDGKIYIVHPDAFRLSIRIARCTAVPFSPQDPSGLTCDDKVVTTFPVNAPAGCAGNACQGFKTGANFPNLAIDRAGNLFAVWQQAPVVNCGPGCFNQGDVVGDTLLYWSSSTDGGDTWTPPVQIPTPGLHQNVLSWAAAGDAGRVDVAWYGSDAPTAGIRGPDSSPGLYGVYLTQTLNGTNPAPTFTPPTRASGHHIHNSTMFTLIGRQTGNRALGDFLQMRIGTQGEAIIAYGDTTNRNRLAHAMVVRQNGGSSVLAAKPLVSGDPFRLNSVTDPPHDARYEALGNVGANQPNLDLRSSKITKPTPAGCAGGVACYRVEMKVGNLSSLAPNPSTGNTDTVLDWSTMWFVPSTTDPFGGKTFHVYMESVDGGPARFFVGESARQRIGGGVAFTYPGTKQITGSVTLTPVGPDVITIDVPIADVTVAGAIDSVLRNVTSSTMTLPEPANTVPFDPVTGLGGSLFNLIDVVRAYDFKPRS